jgi:Arc/MetJ-type ribon-helix-helix transcriptional regulator
MTDEEPAGGFGSRVVRLPEEVARALEERIRGSSFESIDAFVTFVLARLLEQTGETVFSEEDERVLKERLRSLGYID